MQSSASAIDNNSFGRTGPRSDAGKEIASNNATKHGGTSKKLIVPGEDPADFDALLSGFLTDYRPDTSQSRLFVQNVAHAQWFLMRRLRAYNAIEAGIYQAEPDEAMWTGQQLKRLALADRYKTQAERSLKRALNNIDGLQKWALSESKRETANAHWASEQDVRERRITLQEGKFHLSQARAAEAGIGSAKNVVSSPSAPTSGFPLSDDSHANRPPSLKNSAPPAFVDRSEAA